MQYLNPKDKPKKLVETIINPGLHLFFQRNGMERPTCCPQCSSPKLFWTCLKGENPGSDNHKFIGWELNCYTCFTKIEYREEKESGN